MTHASAALSLASKRVKARLFYSPFNRDAIRTRCHKTPTKSMANEAQLGAMTQFETIQNILWPLNQVV